MHCASSFLFIALYLICKFWYTNWKLSHKFPPSIMSILGSRQFLLSVFALSTLAFVATVNVRDGASLSGQAIGKPQPEINAFTTSQCEEGVVIKANDHNQVRCSGTGTFPMFTGTFEKNDKLRFWGYEFNGDEPPFNGKFKVSRGELRVNPKYGIINKLGDFQRGKAYYFMTEQDLFFKCGEGLSLRKESISATIAVAVKSLATTDTATENQNDINLLRFEARAGAVEDVLLTTVAFADETDPKNLYNVVNYTLWVDTDDNGKVDTILEGNGVSDGNRVVMDNLKGGGYSIPAEKTIVFELHGDMASALTSSQMQLAFATTADKPYIKVETLDDGTGLSGIETDGKCNAESCQIFVTTQKSTEWRLTSQGNLLVKQDSTPLRSHQYLGGELGEPALRLTFRADSEPIDVTDIRLTDLRGSRSIDRLELYMQGATTPFAQATVGGCGNDVPANNGSTFCANMENQQFIVPENEEIDVIVRPRIKSDTNGGESGEQITVGLTLDTPQSIEARGFSYSNELSWNNGDGNMTGEIFVGTNGSSSELNKDIVGKENVIVMSKITSITNANPDPDWTPVPTGIAPIGQFKFGAANHSNSNNGMNDAVIDDIVFDIYSENIVIDPDSFRLYNKANPTVQTSCEYAVRGDSTLVVCENLSDSSIDTEIYQGSSITLVLEANIINSEISASQMSSLQVSLTNLGEIGNQETHIQWIDRDSGSSESHKWIEGFYDAIKSTGYDGAGGSGPDPTEAGSLFITQDSTPISNHQILGGTLSDPLLILNLRTDSEPIDVTYIGIDIEGEDQSIERLELYLEGSPTPFAHATFGGARDGDDLGANMHNQQFVIPEGEAMDVIVRALISSDQASGVSGDEFAIAVDQVLARGAESNNDLSINDADGVQEGEIFIGTPNPSEPNEAIIGLMNVVVLSKITSITNANPDPDWTPVPTGIAPIGQFKFGAANHSNSNNGMNDAVIDDIVFDIYSENIVIDPDSFRLYNKANPTVQTSCEYAVRGDSTLVVCENLSDSSIDTEIYQGSSITLVLEANIINSEISASQMSSLQVSLTNLGEIGNQETHIQWIDRDSGSSESHKWIEGFYDAIKSTGYEGAGGSGPVPTCNNNGVCDQNENCECSDCDGEQDGCIDGFICIDGTCDIPEAAEECGNGKLESKEECDDGNSTEGDGCSNTCMKEFCGDGIVQTAIGEQCDNGAVCSHDPSISCRANIDCNRCMLIIGAKTKRCGRDPYATICESDIHCTDVEKSNTCLYYTKLDPSCSSTCIKSEPICGNGKLEAKEQCDDNNEDDEDGCSSMCTVEDGWQCFGDPSECKIFIPTLSVPESTSVTLHSIKTQGDMILITYSKKFDTCAVLETSRGLMKVSISYLCRRGDNITSYIPITSATKEFVQPGIRARLCHIDQINFCSNTQFINNQSFGANILATFSKIPSVIASLLSLT